MSFVVRKTTNFLNKFKLKTAKEKWQMLYEAGRIASEVNGIRAYVGRENYWYTAFGGIFLVVCYVLIFFTVQDNFRRNEFIKTIENCCCLGIMTVVGLIKIKILIITIKSLAFLLNNFHYNFI